MGTSGRRRGLIWPSTLDGSGRPGGRRLDGDGGPTLDGHLTAGGQPHEARRGRPLMGGQYWASTKREMDAHKTWGWPQMEARKMGAHTGVDACAKSWTHTRYFLDVFFTSTK